jgi:hypothetical protein
VFYFSTGARYNLAIFARGASLSGFTPVKIREEVRHNFSFAIDGDPLGFLNRLTNLSFQTRRKMPSNSTPTDVPNWPQMG